MPRFLLILPFLFLAVFAENGVFGKEASQPLPKQDVVAVPAIGAGLCVSNAFQANMVLQRDKPLNIWGWAAPGEEIESCDSTAADSPTPSILKDVEPATVEPSKPADSPQVQNDKPALIDVHVHFFSCQNGFPGSAPSPGSTNPLDKADEWMKANHVDRCINLPLSQSRPHNEAERKQMLENYAKFKGRIDRFCVVYPAEVNSVEEAVKLLTREKEDGAIGFGEHYGVGLKFDDPKNLMLYEACDKVGLPVLFHIDQNKNMDEKGLPRVEHVLKTFPHVTLIAHSFWWKHLSDGTCDRLLKTYPNLYADISATVRMSRIGTDKEFARAFFIRNADKLLFGSDSGWWSLGKGRKPAPEFELIDELHLPADVVEKICRGNAQRLFYGAKAGNAAPAGSR